MFERRDGQHKQKTLKKKEKRKKKNKTGRRVKLWRCQR